MAKGSGEKAFFPSKTPASETFRGEGELKGSVKGSRSFRDHLLNPQIWLSPTVLRRHANDDRKQRQRRKRRPQASNDRKQTTASNRDKPTTTQANRRQANDGSNHRGSKQTGKPTGKPTTQAIEASKRQAITSICLRSSLACVVVGLRSLACCLRSLLASLACLVACSDTVSLLAVSLLAVVCFRSSFACGRRWLAVVVGLRSSLLVEVAISTVIRSGDIDALLVAVD
jgi:hypothetical protein